MLDRCMKSAIFVATATLLVGMASLCVADAAPANASAAAAPDKPKDFKVFNNMAYEGQPDLASVGLIPSQIIYEGAIWKDKKSGVMPDEQDYKAVVAKKDAKPGTLLVLDIEDNNNFKNFITLVKWTHEAAPGAVVGFYAHGTETKALAEAVDAFFPEAYTFGDNRQQWKGHLEHYIKHAHSMAPGKPVYPYIWPQYHHGTAKSWKLINGDYWLFQLETARDCGANGVVLWGAKELRKVKQPVWKDDAPWWQSTLKFMAELKK
jgi:hypothetical protein